jgi:hypothetical protein
MLSLWTNDDRRTEQREDGIPRNGIRIVKEKTR